MPVGIAADSDTSEEDEVITSVPETEVEKESEKGKRGRRTTPSTTTKKTKTTTTATTSTATITSKATGARSSTRANRSTSNGKQSKKGKQEMEKVENGEEEREEDELESSNLDNSNSTSSSSSNSTSNSISNSKSNSNSHSDAKKKEEADKNNENGEENNEEEKKEEEIKETRATAISSSSATTTTTPPSSKSTPSGSKGKQEAIAKVNFARNKNRAYKTNHDLTIILGENWIINGSDTSLNQANLRKEIAREAISTKGQYKENKKKEEKELEENDDDDDEEGKEDDDDEVKKAKNEIYLLKTLSSLSTMEISSSSDRFRRAFDLLQDNPWGIKAWESLLNEAQQGRSGANITYTDVLEAMVSQFPRSGEHWEKLINADMDRAKAVRIKKGARYKKLIEGGGGGSISKLEKQQELLAKEEDRLYNKIDNCFRQSLEVCPHVGLWNLYIDRAMQIKDFQWSEMRRKKKNRAKNQQRDGGYESDEEEERKEWLKDTHVEIFEFVIKNIGLMANSTIIWKRYAAHIRREWPEESNYDLDRKMKRMRLIYQRAIVTPLIDMEDIFTEYIEWQASYNEQMAKAVKDEFENRFNEAKIVLGKKIEMIKSTEDIIPKVALPPFEFQSQQQAMSDKMLINRWIARLQFEESNVENVPIVELQDRVRLTFRLALSRLYHFPEVWHELASFELRCGSMEEESDDKENSKDYFTSFNQENNSSNKEEKEDKDGSALLESGIIEGRKLGKGIGGEIGSQLKSIRPMQIAIEIYKKALSLNYTQDCLLLMSSMADLLASIGQIEEAVDSFETFLNNYPSTLGYIVYQRFVRRVEGIDAARSVFRQTKELRESEVLDHEIYIAHARLEYHWNQEKDVARRVMAYALEKHQHYVKEPTFISYYIKLLLEQHDEKNIRGLVERSFNASLQELNALTLSSQHANTSSSENKIDSMANHDGRNHSGPTKTEIETELHNARVLLKKRMISIQKRSLDFEVSEATEFDYQRIHDIQRRLQNLQESLLSSQAAEKLITNTLSQVWEYHISYLKVPPLIDSADDCFVKREDENMVNQARMLKHQQQLAAMTSTMGSINSQTSSYVTSGGFDSYDRDNSRNKMYNTMGSSTLASGNMGMGMGSGGSDFSQRKAENIPVPKTREQIIAQTEALVRKLQRNLPPYAGYPLDIDAIVNSLTTNPLPPKEGGRKRDPSESLVASSSSINAAALNSIGIATGSKTTDATPSGTGTTTAKPDDIENKEGKEIEKKETKQDENGDTMEGDGMEIEKPEEESRTKKRKQPIIEEDSGETGKDMEIKEEDEEDSLTRKKKSTRKK